MTAKARAASSEVDDFATAVLSGLSSTPKSIPPRYFYDARGSRLFEAITALPEYYPTRTEIAILDSAAREIAVASDPRTVLVELGSGSSRKTEMLLAAMPGLSAYVPIDVSPTALVDASQRLAKRFPRIPVRPVVGDFTRLSALPPEFGDRPQLGFFPGSTIGNFTPAAAKQLLVHWRGLLGRRGRFVVGVDLEKSPRELVSAYDDAQGVTADFNLNLLHRINRELDGTFDLARFQHVARWNDRERRIEMHLVSRAPQEVQVLGRTIAFAEGESIHTENSYKYTVSRFRTLAEDAGWTPRAVWLDAAERFSVHELSATQ
ncbi:MAG: L-histidine N(alpha)-methyltransferase [Hyphomicrobiaceae bacterium]|nr:L-histidine N(alpha)-methyltransferase [Hyphomicrobiaceae bacterium]